MLAIRVRVRVRVSQCWLTGVTLCISDDTHISICSTDSVKCTPGESNQHFTDVNESRRNVYQPLDDTPVLKILLTQ